MTARYFLWILLLVCKIFFKSQYTECTKHTKITERNADVNDSLIAKTNEKSITYTDDTNKQGNPKERQYLSENVNGDGNVQKQPSAGAQPANEQGTPTISEPGYPEQQLLSLAPPANQQGKPTVAEPGIEQNKPLETQVGNKGNEPTAVGTHLIKVHDEREIEPPKKPRKIKPKKKKSVMLENHYNARGIGDKKKSEDRNDESDVDSNRRNDRNDKNRNRRHRTRGSDEDDQDQSDEHRSTSHGRQHRPLENPSCCSESEERNGAETIVPDDDNLPVRDCAAIKKRHPSSVDGVYDLVLKNVNRRIKVWCDMTTEGGGWTVFQKRGDYGAKENFTRNFKDYENGFGNPAEEYWMGLENIEIVTKNEPQTLRIDMQDFDEKWKYAKYDLFGIKPEKENYQLKISGYSGDAGDSLSAHNGLCFGTIDRGRTHCSKQYQGGWWWAGCHWSNLNGKYLRGPHKSYGDGVNWYHFRGFYHSLKIAEMKMRPKSYK